MNIGANSFTRLSITTMPELENGKPTQSNWLVMEDDENRAYLKLSKKCTLEQAYQCLTTMFDVDHISLASAFHTTAPSSEEEVPNWT